MTEFLLILLYPSLAMYSTMLAPDLYFRIFRYQSMLEHPVRYCIVCTLLGLTLAGVIYRVVRVTGRM